LVKLLQFFSATETENYWWEPGTPGVLDIGDISVFLGALIAFSTVFMMVSRWWMKTLRKIINEELTIATEPIHPNANGGLSLADVARKSDRLDARMDNLEKILERAVEISEKEAQILQDSKPKPATRSRKTSAPSKPSSTSRARKK
jgi:hypothetical protein